MRRPTLAAFLILAISACSSIKSEQHLPKDDKTEHKESFGRLTGEDGFLLLGTSDAEKAAMGSPIGVNSFLWRATLDTLSFMPLASADPFGGVIITDWYEDARTPGERFKVNALILDKTLRADGVKLTIFKQKQAGGQWRDQQVDEKLARTLEDTILTRARALRIAQGGK